MSVDQIGEKEFARRNLWEATLFDENHDPLLWSTGLIKSTNIPKLQFTVDDIYAGTSKGYTGWKLPDNLQISIWETSDHMVEKYFDEWMIGKTGVLNIDPEKGVAFRSHSSEDFIYRDVQIKTFIYEYEEDESYEVKRKDVISKLILHTKKSLQEFSTPLTVEQYEYIHAVSEIAVADARKVILEKKQVIPILDKFTAAIGGIANQLVARVSVNDLTGRLIPSSIIPSPLVPFVKAPIPSDLTRRIIPPVVIPPPLMKIPVARGEITKDYLAKSSLQGKSVPITLLQGIRSKAEEILVDFAAGEAKNAKKWKSSEKTTSLITYNTAIESYDIGTYDYSTGDGVSYNVNLPVRDIKIDYPS